MQHAPAWQKALIPGSILAALLLIGLPLLNAFGILSDYYLNLFGKYLALADEDFTATKSAFKKNGERIVGPFTVEQLLSGVKEKRPAR